MFTSGKLDTAVRAIFYGPEGVGKSTLASKLPAPAIIDVEGSTNRLDLKKRYSPKTYEDFLSRIEKCAGMDDVQTVVIDTVDWLEKLIERNICKKNDKDSFAIWKFRTGEKIAKTEFFNLLNKLEKIINSGKNVVFISHSTIQKFEQPEERGAYDRYVLKCDKDIVTLLMEWAELILFCNYKTIVETSTKGNKRYFSGGKERIAYATHTTAFDAKNRFDLPDQFPLDIKNLNNVFKLKNIEKPLKRLLDNMQKNNIIEKTLLAYLDGKVDENIQTVQDIPESIIIRLNNNWVNIINQIETKK